MIDPVPDLYIGFHAFAENLVSTNIHTGTELRAAFQMFDFGTRRSLRLVQWKSLATFMTLSHLTSMPSVDESTLTVTNCVTYSVSIKLKENWCICHHFYSGSQQIFRLSAKTKTKKTRKGSEMTDFKCASQLSQLCIIVLLVNTRAHTTRWRQIVAWPLWGTHAKLTKHAAAKFSRLLALFDIFCWTSGDTGTLRQLGVPQLETQGAQTPKYVICCVFTFIDGFMEAKLMVTTTTDDRANIGQSASGRWNGRVVQKWEPSPIKSGAL